MATSNGQSDECRSDLRARFVTNRGGRIQRKCLVSSGGDGPSVDVGTEPSVHQAGGSETVGGPPVNLHPDDADFRERAVAWLVANGYDEREAAETVDDMMVSSDGERDGEGESVENESAADGENYQRLLDDSWLDSGVRIPLPDIRQGHSWDCGAAALRVVCAYYGVVVAEQDVERMLEVDREGGTRPDALMRACQELGLRFLDFRGDFEGVVLEACVMRGWPVICPVQYEGTLEERVREECGHYVVVNGVDGGMVWYHDPSAGQQVMERGVFLARWHDRDALGREYPAFGLAVWR